MKIKKQKLPKWFKGELYEEGATVRNRFSGEKYELNNVELSMYDMILGATAVVEMSEYPFMATDEVVSQLRRGLDWFRSNNLDAYMALLD
jgi:hypothetical protein